MLERRSSNFNFADRRLLMVRFVGITSMIGVAAILSACAPPPSQSEISASHAKLADYATEYPLTPAMRNAIASVLMASSGPNKGNVTSAEISFAKIDLRSAQIGDVLNTPYYCVRLHTQGILGIKGQQEYKIIARQTAPGRYLFTKLSSRSGVIYACLNNVVYQPFPELERYYRK